MKVNLLEFDLDGLAAFCEQLGEKRFRATQLFRWLHQRGADDFDHMSDLAKSLREKLKGCAHVQALPVISEHQSADGTSRRSLFPKTIGERFVFHPRPVVQWDAGFVPPVTRGSVET